MYSSLSCLGMYIAFIIINCIALGDSLNEIIVFNLPKTGWSYTL